MHSFPLAISPESQLTAEQSLTGRHWNSPEKIPHVQRQRRSCNETVGGAHSIKSNPITAKWVTHKLEKIIQQKSTQWSEGSEPQIRLRNLGVWQWEEEFSENQTLKPSEIWLQDFDRTGGNRDSTLGGHTQSSVSGPRGKEQWPHRILNQTYLLVLEGLLQRWRGAVAHRGDKNTSSRSSKKDSLAWALQSPQLAPSKSL